MLKLNWSFLENKLTSFYKKYIFFIKIIIQWSFDYLNLRPEMVKG